MSFNKTLALELVRCAEKSYVRMTYSQGNDGFLLETDLDGNQMLAFPGSLEIMDWIEDAEFVKVKRDGMGWIHNGFADMWDRLKIQVEMKLDRTKPLYIVGHSLGGAVATVAALALHNKGFKIDGLYTVGSPRVGNSEWKKKFNESGIEYHRIVNGDDIVTTVPKLFYYHVGNEVKINKRGFFSWAHNKFLDHKMENYLSSLENYK
jgi:triacylglycerol lipase